jgi:hypothetical protein
VLDLPKKTALTAIKELLRDHSSSQAIEKLAVLAISPDSIA